ncbi:hypothetical protein [Pseudonocardia sp.]|uniref:hypothetical protein n=1 Tax=Pseudonocardia sp. TaxID=60912 RepID=UPI003D0AF9D7
MPFRRNALRTADLVGLVGDHVVRVAELAELGVGRRTTAHRCRSGGPWRWLLPGVVRLSNGPVTRDDRRRAALVYAGPRAVLTGLDALHLHGLSRLPAPAGPVHVLVPAGIRRAGGGRVLAERTERLPDPVPGRWPLAPVTRAALDFCRRSRERDIVRSVLAEAVQSRRCTPAELRAELALGCSRGSALPREVLREIIDGVRSVAEADARRIALSSGVPRPRWNVTLVDRDGRLVAIVDGWFEEAGMAWEIDSREYHALPGDYERTVQRRAALMALGVVVMQTLPSALRRDPDGVRSQLRANHARASLLPSPAVRALPS